MSLRARRSRRGLKNDDTTPPQRLSELNDERRTATKRTRENRNEHQRANVRPTTLLKAQRTDAAATITTDATKPTRRGRSNTANRMKAQPWYDDSTKRTIIDAIGTTERMNKQRAIDSMNKRDNYSLTNSTRRPRINERRYDAAKTTERIERRTTQHDQTITKTPERSRTSGQRCYKDCRNTHKEGKHERMNV